MDARYRQLVPVLVAALACAGTFGAVALGLSTSAGYRYALSWPHYGGLAAIALLLGTFLWGRRFYAYVLLGCVILATAGVIRWLLVQVSLSVGFGEVVLPLSADGLLLGLLVYALNYRTVNARLLRVLGPDERQRAQAYQETVAVRGVFGINPASSLTSW